MIGLISVVLTIPYIIIVWAMVCSLLQENGSLKGSRFNYKEDFLLDSNTVSLLYKIVWIWLGATVMNFFFPVFGIVLYIINIVIIMVSLYWLYECYKAGKFKVWFNKK